MAADAVDEARRVDRVFRDKARAELAAAESFVTGVAVRGQGDVLAEVLLVKGEPGPGDVAGKRALAGDDGGAIGKALDALELPRSRYAFCTRAGKGTPEEIARRVRAIAEAVDPRVVVLLDAEAACDFAAAFGVERPVPGIPVRASGRTVIAVEDFEGSLVDDRRKRRAWAQLRAVREA